jgi:hypothetical protein
MTQERKVAKLVAKWVMTDNFRKLEMWEDEYGCISTFLDEMWDLFAEEAKMCSLLEKAYNKWTAEY